MHTSRSTGICSECKRKRFTPAGNAASLSSGVVEKVEKRETEKGSAGVTHSSKVAEIEPILQTAKVEKGGNEGNGLKIRIVTKELRKETPREVSKEVSKEVSNETPSETPKIKIPKIIIKKGVSAGVSGESSKETSNHDHSDETPNETPSETPKESIKLRIHVPAKPKVEPKVEPNVEPPTPHTVETVETVEPTDSSPAKPPLPRFDPPKIGAISGFPLYQLLQQNSPHFHGFYDETLSDSARRAQLLQEPRLSHLLSRGTVYPLFPP